MKEFLARSFYLDNNDIPTYSSVEKPVAVLEKPLEPSITKTDTNYTSSTKTASSWNKSKVEAGVGERKKTEEKDSGQGKAVPQNQTRNITPKRDSRLSQREVVTPNRELYINHNDANNLPNNDLLDINNHDA